MEDSTENGPTPSKQQCLSQDRESLSNSNPHTHPTAKGILTSGDEVKTDSQTTEEYSLPSEPDSQNLDQGNKTVIAHTNKINGQINTDMVRPAVTKIESVLRDAQKIATVICNADVDKIYEKLKENRANPRRIDLVMNDILENTEKYNITKKSKLEDSISMILEDFVKVIDKAMANMEKLPLPADQIQELLIKEGNRQDRVDRVFAQILKRLYQTGGENSLPVDVSRVLMVIPGADVGEVRKLVSKRRGQADRVKQVVSILQPRHVTALKKDDSFPDDPALKNDPLFRDMRIVKKVMPHRDPNEIYAFLEAHYDKRNRIRFVIEELMSAETDLDDVDEDGGCEESGLKVQHMNGEGLSSDVKELQEIFPDCDPNYLYNALEDRKDDKDRVKKLAIKMLEQKNYPKLKDVLDNEEKFKKKQKIVKQVFNIEDFLAKFPNPEEFFCDKNREVSSNYREHVSVHIHNDFPNLSTEFLKQVLDACKSHLILCQREILTNISNLGEFAGELYISTPRAHLLLPDVPDELFFCEKFYLDHEKEIQERLKEQKILKELRREEAKGNGELLDCKCCYDDECLFEDMAACADGHIFCKDCIRRSSEVVIGDGKCDFPCLTDDCDYKFPLPVLQQVMTPNMFSILLRRMQEEEIKKAEIPDLVSCPFCSFATIMSDPNDKVFKCLNPECLKDSCRLCGEPSHIPLRCNEVEKEGETAMRVYIEARVTESMLRKCHKCDKRFIKETGCNMMTCTCGARQCYTCREKDIDYNHFDSHRDCQLAIESKLHVEEMEEAAREAKKQYLEEHPQAKDIVLKYDPNQHVQDVKRQMEEGADRQYHDSYDEYDGEYDSEGEYTD